MTSTDLPALFQRLVAVQVELFDAVDARLRAEAGMPLVTLLPLRVIAGRDGCRVQELAAGLGITVGGASKSADRLERDGSIRRVAHPDDRRSSLLELTEAGRERLRAGEAVVAAVMQERVVAELGESAAAELSSSLGRLRRGG